MINLKDKWRELSIDKKFRVVFALQNFSLFLAWLFLDANFGALFFLGFFVLFASCVPENDWARDWTKKGLFIISALIMIYWFLENSMSLRADVDVNYNQLKSYSGITVPEQSLKSRGGSNVRDYMRLEKHKDEKNQKKETRLFICGIKFYYSCTEELRNYFGRENTYNQNISVKYYEFPDIGSLAFIPLSFYNQKAVYEMIHNDKVIYDYNYFVSKYRKQQRNSIIYAIYLIVNTLVFCIFYHLIQKSSVQHTQ